MLMMIFRNRKLLIGALLTLLLLCLGVSAFAATATVSVESLILREEPSTKSDVLQTLEKGDKLEVVYKDGSWYKVKYGRYTGFVMTRYVKANGSVPDKGEVEAMREGSRGTEVKNMQKRLKELGYLTGSADGVFGPKTTEAVKAFQKRNGLTADGVVGEETLKKLNSSSAKAAESSSSNSSSSSGSSSSTTDTTLRSGSRGEAVKKLQQP